MFNPKDVVKKFGVREGSIVADLGVGYGHYAYALSEMVGESGKVFAVDIQKDLLNRLKKESEEKGIKNIEIIWGDVEVLGGTKIRQNSIDSLVISNVLSQIESKVGLVDECGRILKSGGRILLIDWAESIGPIGPPAELIVDQEEIKKIFEGGHFKFRENIPAGEHHYGLIFEKTVL